MLLGDSITAGINGSNPVGGYRDDLDSMLVSVDAVFDFIGTLNDGLGFDADHEGHGGWTVDMILADIDSFMHQTGPEIILTHLGTNDISSEQDIPGILAELDSLLAKIYNYNVNMVVYLSGIIPRNDSMDSLTTQLNGGIIDLVTDWSSGGYSVKFIDQNGAFKANPNWQTDYLFDHVHPNNAGYAVMAITYFDSLVSENIYGQNPSEGPAPITDLSVDRTNSRTALLTWTATGNIDTIGIADRYDVRYSTSPITEENFSTASQAVGEPDPLPYGSPEEFTAGGLNPETIYYFAIKAISTTGNPSPLSNVPVGETIFYPVAVDAFERTDLGPDWFEDSSMVIINGELSNTSSVENWDSAIYVPVTNAESISLRWGSDVDSLGIGVGGMVLMLDSTSPDSSNGYFIFRHHSFNYYAIWTVIDGTPDMAVAQSPVSTLPFPGEGDSFEVVLSSDIHGHHFDCYINGVYDTRVSDSGKLQGNGPTLWSGIMLLGNRNNNVEDFWVSGQNASLPPGVFSLLSPVNGDTIETGTPLLDWEDSIDPNPTDSVFYALYFGLSAVFAPESTLVIDNLTESEYQIPEDELLTLSAHEGSRSEQVIETEFSSLPDSVVVYWKVKAWNLSGQETWSLQTDWSFTVIIFESPFSIFPREPRNGGRIVIPPAPVLSWELSPDPASTEISHYKVYYDTDSALTDPVVIDGIKKTRHTIPSLETNTWYYWRVEAIDGSELVTHKSDILSFLVLAHTDINLSGDLAPPTIPKVFALGQNYPNPFNPSTSIRYDIPAGFEEEGGVNVQLHVYNLRGQLIRTLENSLKAPGSYVVHWDGRDEKGERAGSGIYLYRVVAGPFSDIKKMIIAK
jgi:lysophospholipase L1-like esterase